MAESDSKTTIAQDSLAAGAHTEIAAPPPDVTRHRSVKLKRSASADDAIEAIFGANFAQWLANEALVLEGTDPEGVHEMRVALRRMRTALADFKKLIPAAQLGWMKRETRWLLANLGPARNWDTFLIELAAPVEAAMVKDSGLAELRQVTQARRAEGYALAQEAVRSARYEVLVAWMRRWLLMRRWRHRASHGPGAPLAQPARKLAVKLLKKRHKAALRLAGNFESLSAAERHRLRIALKKLRYTAEFFRSFFAKEREREYLAVLAALQDSLGHLNDVAVAEHLLQDLVGEKWPDQEASNYRLPYATGLVIGWHAHNANNSINQAVVNWREFCACKPFWTSKR
jgi:triphosphatase